MNNQSAIPSIPAAKKESVFNRVKAKFLHGEYSYLFWAFFLPFLIMTVIYIALQTYPFGKSSVLVLDLNGQYVYFFEALRDWVYGEGSLLYSFGRALGGEFMGIYAYYLASPLSYIVALFPKHAILEALFLMLVLKCGLCGFTFGFYLHKTHRGCSKTAVVMFSLMYALTAYAVVYQHNTMWIDNLILLPLIAFGLEQLIKFRKYKLFTITLALALLSNFYIGYMTCIFVFVYFLYYYSAKLPDDEINPLGERAHFAKSVGRTALFSALAIGISCVVLLPALYSLTFGKTTFSDPSFNAYQQFDFLRFLSMFFPGSYDTVRPEGLPLVYCGTATILLLPMYFISGRIKRAEKIASAVLIAFFVVSFNLRPLDMVWHGFQRPNWLNNRYSFMLCFILLVLAFKVFINIKEVNYKHIYAVGCAYIFMLCVFQAFEYKNVPDFAGVWLGIGAVIIFATALCICVKTRTPENTAMIVTVLVALELFSAGLLNMVSLDEDVVISSYSSYHEFIDEIQPIIDTVKENDESFYRMEKTEHRKVNDPLALGMRGLSNSTSTLNSDTIDFLAKLGMSSKSHWSKYQGGTPVFDSLLGLKYLITEHDEDVSDLYNVKFEDEKYYAYENPFALSLACAVNSDIANVAFSESDDEEDEESETTAQVYLTPFERMNAVITAMLGSEESVQLFKPITLDDTSYDNINPSYASAHRAYFPINSQTKASVIFTVKAVKDYHIYCYFPSDYAREVNLTLNGAAYGTFFGNETDRVIDLGSFADGDEVRLSLTLTGSDLYIKTAADCFWYLDEETFREVMPLITAGNYNIEEYKEDYFTGTITAGENSTTVYTSLPFDKGWKIKVDGEAVESYEVLGALVAFDVTPGTHTLEMKYLPDCFVIGVAATALSSLILLLFMIFEKKINHILYRGESMRCLDPVAVSVSVECARDKIIPDSDIYPNNKE